MGGRRSTRHRGEHALTVLLVLAPLLLASTPASARAPGVSTGVTVEVLQALTLSSDVSTVELSVDPASGEAGSADRVVVTLNVLTNSGSGYTLYVNDESTGLYSPEATYEIPRVATAGGLRPYAEPTSANPSFGVSADLRSSGESAGSECSLLGDFARETWNPYAPGPVGLCARRGPTPSADVVRLTSQVGVDYDVPAGTYSDTICYTAATGY